MKKYLQLALLSILAVGIGYQVHIFIQSKNVGRPTIPAIPITLLDGTETSIDKWGANKHTVVFLIRSDCAFCKKEVSEVRKHLGDFAETEVLFVSFEDTDVISNYKHTMLPEESAHVTFAKASQEQVEPFLYHGLVFPYLLWYDKAGIQKAQHRGLFPVSRILEVIDQSS